jgi:phosphoserine aminotransferase
MSNIFNFCAGPAMLPAAVMNKAQGELVNYQQLGSSVMEISHRSAPFIAVAERAEADLRELLNIPNNYKVLFCHGGGRGQFSAVPLNLLPAGATADYIVSGSWSKAAAQEAKKFGQVNIIDVQLKTEQGVSLQPVPSWPLTPDAAYVHYCPNETVDGIEIFEIPQTNGVPLVADLSSTILSHPIDISKFGLIYAGAQKNIGPSGLTIVIVREDLLGRGQAAIPCIMDYQLTAEHGSMYNTPPTYAWYLAGLVFDWLKQRGGVAEIANVNQQKAAMLYQFIDSCPFYRNHIASEFRSRMNVTFWLADEQLNLQFITEAEQAGLVALEGHRSVGGMRASIYNAMPIEGVQALVAFMAAFAVQHSQVSA